ncbi:MAG: threonine--tRNA ligase [Bacillota bacterium]
MDISIILPDGSVKQYQSGTTVGQIAASIGAGLARDALGGKLDGRSVGLSEPLEHGGHLRILTFADGEGRAILRHSVAHVLAQAVKRLLGEVQLGIGPAIEDGFYYDFDLADALTSDDLPRIEEEMRSIVAEDLPFEREVLSREEALALFRDMNEPYKVELIEEMPEDEQISCYRQGEFVDLCRGPHLPSTGRLRAFRLLSVAGAYWRGDETRPQLQRVYGTAFDKQSDLEDHLHHIEEARRRDHRRLGRELELYSTHEEGGAGLIYWHPRGAVVREVIEDFWRTTHRERGYDIVYTPHIAKKELWAKSGHLETFRDDMFNPIEVDSSEYLLKPMNCPFHILMYQAETRSYRDLPMRWAEMGTVYRYERSGVLHGLLRVRGFTQDDAHIFCRPDQVEEEIIGVVRLAQYMLTSFGYSQYEVALSTRGEADPDKYIGHDDAWEKAETALAHALQRIGLEYTEEPGEAKFYGPAIDIKMLDALGRGWQGPTIQLDFNLPERFDLGYVGSDGEVHRPVMIHRTVLGSMERFFGGLVEHYAGAFPTWLAPVQVVLLPITDDHSPYARQVASDLAAHGVRVHVDDRNEKVGYKIRAAEMQKTPYMLVVGDREVGDETVSVRTREQGDLGPRPYAEFIEAILRDIEERSLTPAIE